VGASKYMRRAFPPCRRPCSRGAWATRGIAGAVFAVAVLLLTALPSSASAPPTVLTITPPWGAVGASSSSRAYLGISGCQGNGSAVSIGSRPSLNMRTGLAKASASMTIVDCGPNQTGAWSTYHGHTGMSGIRFNISTLGRYYVSVHLSGYATYSAAANLTTTANLTPTSFADMTLDVGMRIQDASNASWGHGIYNEQAKNCGPSLKRYCQLVSQVVSLASTRHVNGTIPISVTLTWFSAPYQRLVPGDTYEVGGAVHFSLFLTSSSVAAGSVSSAALSFRLHFTSMTVQGPF
jgi:hypothetical protein